MYTPRHSHYTPPPARRYHRNALDRLVHNAYFVPQSAHAKVAGRKVLSTFALATRDFYASLPKLPDPTLHPLPQIFGSSALSTWKSCKRKFFWSHISNLRPIGGSVHLVAGAAFAAGTEAARRYVHTHPQPTLVTLEEMLIAAYPAFEAEWGDYPPFSDNPRVAKDFVNTFTSLGDYLNTHHPALDPIQPLKRPDGTPAVEYKFAIPLGINHPVNNEPFLFVGRFDLLGSYHLGSEHIPVVVDEKTTSSLGWAQADQWSLRGQFLGYVWAMQQQGVDLDHVAVRSVAILKRETQFQTSLVQVPRHTLQRWEDQLYTIIQAISDTYMKWLAGGDSEELFPYDFGEACSAYGGCPYSTLCNVIDPEPFLSNYTIQNWDFLALQPTKEPTHVTENLRLQAS